MGSLSKWRKSRKMLSECRRGVQNRISLQIVLSQKLGVREKMEANKNIVYELNGFHLIYQSNDGT